MKKVFIGFDVGGTNIAAGLVSRQGRIFDVVSQPTQASKGKKQVIKNTLKILDELLDKDIECLGVCLAWPGKSNMPLSGLEIKRLIKKKYKYPVFLQNDADSFTLSEALLGQGKKYKRVFGITLGTGVGSGLVVDKKLIAGLEFGHTSMNFNGPKCACGNYGCFEEYAGSRALKRLAKKYKLKVNSGEELYNLASQGNKQALNLWDEFGHNLGLALIGAARAYEPDIIILGGQISKANKFFGQKMNKTLKYKNSFRPPLIIVSKLKNAAISAAAFVDK